MKIDIYFDGSCKNEKDQSSPIGVGVAVLINNEYDNELSRSYSFATFDIKDRGTNNLAEWLGCVHAFEAYAMMKKAYPKANINVYGDSQNIIRQFNRVNAIREESFKKYAKMARDCARGKEAIWIPREQNKEADRLAGLGRQVALEKEANKPLTKNQAKFLYNG